MNRREVRELALHLIFTADFQQTDGEELLRHEVNEDRFSLLRGECDLYAELPPDRQLDYLHDAVIGTLARREELDGYIAAYAVGWSLNRISRICKCILRLSMYETKYLDIPVASSINEAVEFARAYDSEEASAFVNGILGTFASRELPQ